MKRKLKWLTIVLAVLLLGFGTALLLWPRDRITAESWQKIRKSIFIHPPFLLGSATVRMTRTWRGFRMQRTAMEMDMQQYLKNRLQFPMDTLARHAGNWIASAIGLAGKGMAFSLRPPRSLRFFF